MNLPVLGDVIEITLEAGRLSALPTASAPDISTGGRAWDRGARHRTCFQRAGEMSGMRRAHRRGRAAVRRAPAQPLCRGRDDPLVPPRLRGFQAAGAFPGDTPGEGR